MHIDPLLQDLLIHRGFPVDTSRDLLLKHTLEAFSRIPYENLTKIIRSKESPGSRHKETPAELIHGYIQSGTGGTCFPLTRTLVYLLNSLGYEAHPILADRRYGCDTHCAVIVRLEQKEWELIDPGYLIFSPCKLPKAGNVRYELPLTGIELRAHATQEKIDLYTTSTAATGELTFKYRLTYKTTPVDTSELLTAWDRSFNWEMMHYPIVSSLLGDTQLYLQKNALLVRSKTDTSRTVLSPSQIIQEMASKLSISEEIVRRALKSL